MPAQSNKGKYSQIFPPINVALIHRPLYGQSDGVHVVIFRVRMAFVCWGFSCFLSNVRNKWNKVNFSKWNLIIAILYVKIADLCQFLNFEFLFCFVWSLQFGLVYVWLLADENFDDNKHSSFTHYFTFHTFFSESFWSFSPFHMHSNNNEKNWSKTKNRSSSFF